MNSRGKEERRDDLHSICVRLQKKMKKNIDYTHHTHHNPQHMVQGKERATKIAFYLLTLKQIVNNKVSDMNAPFAQMIFHSIPPGPKDVVIAARSGNQSENQ